MTEKKKPQNLYHFTKIETAIKYILPEMSLRMNKLINMNDPKENLLYKTNFKDGYKLFAFLQDYALAKKVQNETNVISFSVDRQIEVENKPILIHRYKLQRMWAQYGGNNTGACLVIDYEEFINENKEIIFGNEIIDDFVFYDYYSFQELPSPLYGKSTFEKRPSIETIIKDENHWNALKTNRTFIKNRFFTKNIDWQGESEYRFLTFKKSEYESGLSIEKSLKKVILGIDSSRHFLPSIIDKIEKSKVYYITLDSYGNLDINNV